MERLACSRGFWRPLRAARCRTPHATGFTLEVVGEVWVYRHIPLTSLTVYWHLQQNTLWTVLAFQRSAICGPGAKKITHGGDVLKCPKIVSGVLRAAWGTAASSLSFLLRHPLHVKRTKLSLNPPYPEGDSCCVFSTAHAVLMAENLMNPECDKLHFILCREYSYRQAS